MGEVCVTLLCICYHLQEMGERIVCEIEKMENTRKYNNTLLLSVTIYLSLSHFLIISCATHLFIFFHSPSILLTFLLYLIKITLIKSIFLPSTSKLIVLTTQELQVQIGKIVNNSGNHDDYG